MRTIVNLAAENRDDFDPCHFATMLTSRGRGMCVPLRMHMVSTELFLLVQSLPMALRSGAQMSPA